MQKKLKFLLFLFVISVLFTTFTYATDIDPTALSDSYNNATTNSTSNTTTNTAIDNTTSAFANSSSNTTNTMSNSLNNTTSNTTRPISNTTTAPTTTTSSSSLPEADLGLGNILSIILIVIGALLFFLGIAILVRMKS